MSLLRLHGGSLMMLLWAMCLAFGADTTEVHITFLVLTAGGFAVGLDESYRRRRNGHHPST